MFSLDVGTDLHGTKHNTTLTFPQRPSVAELASATESYFDTKSRACRPAGYPDIPFKIETFQLFDDTLLRWVDLYDTQQLRQGAQLWCFQPESIWHSDAQGVIPQAEKAPFTWTTPLGSPRRARVAADAGVPPTLSEKLRSVFYQIDGQNKGYLLYNDIEAAFRRCDMEFNCSTAEDLFRMADANRSSHITYDEWVNFAIRCPNVVDALFFRMRDMYQDGMVPSSPPGPDAQRMRQQELQGYYQDSWVQQREAQQREYDAMRRNHEREQNMAAEKHAQAQAAAAQHAAAMEQAQQAAQQHAAAHAAAKQAAAEHAAAAQQAQQAVQQAQAAMERAAAQQAAAEQAAAQAAQQQAIAQQQIEQEAAARKAAESEAAAAAQQAQQAAMAAQEAAAKHAAAQQAAQQATQQPSPNSSYPPYQPPSPAPVSQPQYYRPQPPPSASPQRAQALSEYELAKRKADELRAKKEEAEREEREAWNRLYYSPASPQYGS
eukprot:Sspe_Gene.74452::Locus_46210_Transcript_1_1_Confidence_1.000_Length_1546::g.74452::m.74452